MTGNTRRGLCYERFRDCLLSGKGTLLHRFPKPLDFCLLCFEPPILDFRLYPSASRWVLSVRARKFSTARYSVPHVWKLRLLWPHDTCNRSLTEAKVVLISIVPATFYGLRQKLTHTRFSFALAATQPTTIYSLGHMLLIWLPLSKPPSFLLNHDYSWKMAVLLENENPSRKG